MGSLSDFNRRMMIRADRVGVNVTKLVRTVAIVADQALVMATPVDTGRARSNWIASVGSAAGGTREPYAPGEGLGLGEMGNAQAAMDQAESVIKTYNSDRDNEIHITNNLDYIEALNDGHSTQAPENFVETALMKAVQAVKRSRIIDP